MAESNALTTDPLRAVERARNRAYVSFIVLWMATVGSLLWFAYTVRIGSSLERALSAAVVSLVFAICMGVFGVMFFTAKMAWSVITAVRRSSSR
jgi:hypothetical protein